MSSEAGGCAMSRRLDEEGVATHLTAYERLQYSVALKLTSVRLRIAAALHQPLTDTETQQMEADIASIHDSAHREVLEAAQAESRRDEHERLQGYLNRTEQLYDRLATGRLLVYPASEENAFTIFVAECRNPSAAQSRIDSRTAPRTEELLL